MNNVSSLGRRIRQIREAEDINRKELAEMLDLPYSSLSNYEMERIPVSEVLIVRFTNHPRFKKYTMWLMTGETAEVAGQIAPPLSHDGQDEMASRRSMGEAG